MADRSELNAKFVSILGSGNVYFQPPETIKMRYPCIVYDISGIPEKFANNGPYKVDRRYSVTVIDRDPDSKIPDDILKLRYCTFDRHFVSDNLHHFTFTLYY